VEESAKKVTGQQQGQRKQTAARKPAEWGATNASYVSPNVPYGHLSRTVRWPRTLMQKANQPLSAQHLCYQFRQPAANRICCLLLDCSASMLRSNKLSVAKGLILQLAQQIHQQGGQLAVIGFRGDQAHILKQPDQLTDMNERWIRSIQGGGGTPLCLGIAATDRCLHRYQRQFPGSSVDCWLLTDGRFHELPDVPRVAGHYTVIDFEDGRLRLARARQLAQRWQANYLRAVELLGPMSLLDHSSGIIDQ